MFVPSYFLLRFLETYILLPSPLLYKPLVPFIFLIHIIPSYCSLSLSLRKVEARPIFNHDQDLVNDQRQPSSLYFAETDMLQEFGYPILAPTLEPLLRKVVREEIDHKLQQYFSPEILALTKPSSLPQIQAQEQPRFKLVFPKNLKLPIFTANKLLDIDNNPPEIHIVDINSNIGEQMTPISLHSAPKVELLVLNGDFPPKGCESWTSNQFEANIVKERNDKPPLLLGELIVTLNGGSATIGDIEFSDNSSWIRSRKFKIGARVVPGTNLQGSVLEAITEGFVVKEYRVGLTRKHETPMGHYEVWRLVNIRKDGVFHKRLASHHIHTVLDFLNLFDNDPKKLRRILGARISDKKWEAVLKHAKTCKVDNNVAQELGSTHWVQQGIVPETTSLNQGVLMEQQNRSHAQPIGNSHTVHQHGIMTESTLPTQVVFMERQNVSHVQPNKHQKNNDDGEGSVSFGSLDPQAFLAFPSPSQLNNFNPAGFQENEFFPSPSQFDRFNPGLFPSG